MNLSPTRNHLKPRVSFVYQNQSPQRVSPKPATPTPKSGKQNFPILSYSPKVLHHTPSVKILNISNQKNLMPPQISQAAGEKQRRNFVPAFLVNKQKEKQKINLKEGENEKSSKVGPANLSGSQKVIEKKEQCRCGKNPTHSNIKTQQKYCTKCGVEKMMEGVDIQEYVSPDKNSEGNETLVGNTSSFLGNSAIKHPPREMELEQLLKEMQQERKGLQKKYENIEQQDKQIHRYFKDRKIELKAHYEKVKAAIKQSIQQDLRELTEMENEKIEEWKSSRALLNEEIQKIEKVQESIKPNIDSLLHEKDEGTYLNILNKSKAELSRISSQMEKSSVSGYLKNELQAPVCNEMVYKPQIYRMHSKQLNDASFTSKLTNDHSPKLGKSQKPLENDGGILFSFEGKKINSFQPKNVKLQH